MGASPGFASISGWFVELDEKEPSALSETLITMALQVPQQSGCAELSRMSGRRGLSYVLARLEPNGPRDRLGPRRPPWTWAAFMDCRVS